MEGKKKKKLRKRKGTNIFTEIHFSVPEDPARKKVGCHGETQSMKSRR